MTLATQLPRGWERTAPALYVLAGDRGAERTAALQHQIDMARLDGCRTWLLSCDFDEGGPWAGIRDLLRSIVPNLTASRPELLERHSYELVHVLPTLRRQVTVRNESLTDVSLGSERVRNFPADRAIRSIHGLVDLLMEAREASDGPWVLACDSLDRIGPIGKRFFCELLRRRGRDLGLVVLAGTDPAGAAELQADFTAVAHCETFSVPCRPGWPKVPGPAENLRRAQEMEERTHNKIEMQELIPDLIRAWREAGDESQAFRWQLKALELYPTLGFYEDALRYSEAVRSAVAYQALEQADLRWMVFFKTFASLAALQRPELALQLAEDEGLCRLYDVRPMFRAQIFYLLAMLYVRFLPQRDFEKGEALLERGIVEVERIADPEDRAFSHVFNRNGLALVRNLQGRGQEAIDLCREGYERLQAELGTDKHRLHRSVLIYNMAQVYAALGAHDQALAHYSAAMEMDPYYSEYYNERGNLLLALGKMQDAYIDYRTAIAFSPPYPEVHTNLGQCCRLLKRFDEAVEAYTTALDLKPDVLLAYVGRAEAYDELGRTEEALADYDVALRLQPEAPDLLANRAVLRFQVGRWQESLRDLSQAIELAPEMPELYENRAFLLSEFGRPQEAVEDLRLLSSLPLPQEHRTTVEAKIRLLEEALGDRAQAPSSSP